MKRKLTVLCLTLSLAIPLRISAGDAATTYYNNRKSSGSNVKESSCSSTASKEQIEKDKEQARKSLMNLGKALDKIAADVEEYGTVSISSPLLSLPAKKMWFNLNKEASDYYDNARSEVSGRALAATAIAQSLGVGVQAAVDVDQLNIAKAITAQIAPQLAANRELEDLKQKRAQLAYDAKKKELPPNATDQQKTQNELDALTAKQTILQQASGATDPNRPKTDSSNTFEAPSAASTTAVTTQAVDKNGQPVAPGSATQTGTVVTNSVVTDASGAAPRVDPALLALAAISSTHTAVGKAGQDFLGSTIKLPDVDAVKSAESASSLQGLENFFHYPTEAMQFRDKTVLMAAVTVSVEPGWRTAKEFAGEVVMKNSYKFVEARRAVVSRLITDWHLPKPLRQRLAYDYHIPWYSPKEAAEKKVAELENQKAAAALDSQQADQLRADAASMQEKAAAYKLRHDAKIAGVAQLKKNAAPAADVRQLQIEASGLLTQMADTIRTAENLQRRADNAPLLFKQYTTELAQAKEKQIQTKSENEIPAQLQKYNTGGLAAPPGEENLEDDLFLKETDVAPASEIRIPIDMAYNETRRDKSTPLVSGISPLSQTDTLDLASEFQRQDQFALALALALRQQGASGSAKVFEQYVKTQKKDIQTRSVSATVATYSRAGGIVGFQVGPRLRALADPSSRKNKSGFVLERQSFPALLVFGVDEADLLPMIQFDKKAHRLVVYEPKLLSNQHTYWRPLTYKFQGPKDWFNPFKTVWPPIWWEEAQKQTRLVDRSLRLQNSVWDANDDLPSRKDCPSRQTDVRDMLDSLAERGAELRDRYVGAICDQYLPAELVVRNGKVPLPDDPAPTDPSIDAVVPTTIQTKLLPTPDAPSAQMVANAKTAFADANDDFNSHYNSFNTVLTGDRPKVDAQLADDKLNALAKTVFQIVAPNNPNADQIEATRQALFETQRYMDEIVLQYTRANSRATNLKNLINSTSPAPTKVGVLAAAESVSTQATKLTAPLQLTAPLSADFLKALQSVGPNLASYKTLGTRVATDTLQVANTGTAYGNLLDVSTKSPLVPIAILGRDLQKTTKVEVILSAGQATLPALGTADADGQSVTIQNNGILVKVRVGASAVLYLRVTCVVPDPKLPQATRTIILYTPPIVINVGETAMSGASGAVNASNSEYPHALPINAPTRQLALSSTTEAVRTNRRELLNSSAVDSLDLSQNIFSEFTHDSPNGPKIVK